MSMPTTMPALFVSHGPPMLAIEPGTSPSASADRPDIA
jgi:aromatic ring-opening dioxygenase catalytic subunit (LigB family)